MRFRSPLALAVTGSLALAAATSHRAGAVQVSNLDLGAVFNAEAVMQAISPEELAAYLHGWGPRSEEVLTVLSRTFEYSGPASPLADYLAEVSTKMAALVDAAGQWTDDDLDRLLTVQLVNPGRFADSPAFRYQVVALMRQQSSLTLSRKLRVAMTEAVGHILGTNHDIQETVGAIWGVTQRSSGSRQASSRAGGVGVASLEPIETTVAVLTSQFLTGRESADFIAALQRHAPSRDLLLIVDRQMKSWLDPGRWPRTHMLPSLGLELSPWPRDPLILSRRPDGGVEVVIRPNRQPGREGDNDLGRLLVAQLPRKIDSRWRSVTWRKAEAPFHNGQILLTPAKVLVSIHSLEPAILSRLGVDRVPVESFATAEGIDRYLAAADAAALELGAMFGRQAVFGHGLPRTGSAAERRDALLQLGGGGGFDLDSLLTIVPDPNSAAGRALVGDLNLGLELLDAMSEAETDSLRGAYDMDPEVDIATAIREAAGAARGQGLGRFLDAVAAHQAIAGPVSRLPLLLVPTATLRQRDQLQHEDFLIGWNNVVLEGLPGGIVAEGFASGIQRGDVAAAEIFAAADVRMSHLPALISSVVRNGGYRCATNHLRARKVTAP